MGRVFCRDTLTRPETCRRLQSSLLIAALTLMMLRTTDSWAGVWHIRICSTPGGCGISGNLFDVAYVFLHYSKLVRWAGLCVHLQLNSWSCVSASTLFAFSFFLFLFLHTIILLYLARLVEPLPRKWFFTKLKQSAYLCYGTNWKSAPQQKLTSVYLTLQSYVF